MKEYKAVQLNKVIIRDKKNDDSVVKHVEKLINESARQGWNYHSMETIIQADKAGCFGQVNPDSQVSYYVVIFERDLNE